jgi:two-component system chemotaxis response regulator CheB
MSKIRVLIVDDSALMRQVLTELLSQDPEIQVVGTAQDPYFAREKIKALNPDVLTLDVEMPKMDGLTFLEKLMVGHPMPVVMVSSLTEAECQTTFHALELGAVDFITKPRIDLRSGMEEQAQELVAKVKGAAQARVRRASHPVRRLSSDTSRDQNDASRATLCERRFTSDAAPSAMLKTTDTIIAIGASTGGTEAIRELLEALPPNMPPIMITQHMPEKFTQSFAERLNGRCRIAVKEAEDGDSVLPGHALIARGNHHMTLTRNGARLNQGPPVNRHRPSVDVLFQSVAQYAGGNSVGVILTGMGGDGAQGLLAMKRAGAYTVAQDESTCVVFGMPKEAIKLGGVEKILPLADIPAAILTRVLSG